MSDSSTIILGVESSCDETGCAVVADGGRVLGNFVASQVELHERFGGVVPEVASRAHIEAINPVIEWAMASSGVQPSDLSGVAATCEPGLIGSLLVGLTAAKTLAWAWGLPLIGVNHVHAHACSPALNDEPIEYPAAALVASGGHTALYRCASPLEVTLLGATIDDAAGEAFDKVAAILKLGYPGGPAIDRLAAAGDPESVSLPLTLLDDDSLDFSFSGLKTAVLYHVNGVPGKKPDAATARAKGPGYGKGAEGLTDQERADIAASFQRTVARIVEIKCRRAVRAVGARSLVLGGGVAANSAVREAARHVAGELGCVLRLAPVQFCTDNAAMIAALGYHKLQAGLTDGYDLPATATVRR
jgi:N6-L-threonylcarbamoyladenine synthase